MALSPQQRQALIDQTINSVKGEETLAAARKIEHKRGAKEVVIPVRLAHEVYSAVQSIAAARHMPVSVLLRQWVAQGVAAETPHVDIATELERLASLLRAEHV